MIYLNDGVFILSLLGLRLEVKDTTKSPPLFSQRYGYRKVFLFLKRFWIEFDKQRKVP